MDQQTDPRYVPAVPGERLPPDLARPLDALLSASLNTDSLDQLIWAELGENPERVAPGATLEARLAALRSWAEKTARWADLAGALTRQFPKHPGWEAFCARFHAAGWVPASLPARTGRAAQRRQDQTAILDAFRSLPDLERAIFFGGLSAALPLPTRGSIEDKVRALLWTAEQQDRRGDLIRALQQANPGNPHLRQIHP